MTTKNLFPIFIENFFDLLKSLGIKYVSDISAYDEGTMVTFYSINKNILTKKLFIMYHQEMRGLYLDKTYGLSKVYSHNGYGSFSNTLYILHNGVEFQIMNDYLLKVIGDDSSVVKLKFIYNGKLIDLLYETLMLMQNYPFPDKQFNLVFQDSTISIEHFKDTLKNIATYRYDYIYGAKENHIKVWCESDISLQRGSMQCRSGGVDSNIYDLNSSNKCTQLIEKGYYYINHRSNRHPTTLGKEEVSKNIFASSNSKKKSKFACIYAAEKTEDLISETSSLPLNNTSIFRDHRESTLLAHNRKLAPEYLVFREKSKKNPLNAKRRAYRHTNSISDPYRFYHQKNDTVSYKKNNTVSCSCPPISLDNMDNFVMERIKSLNIATANSCLQNNTQDIKDLQKFERNFFISASAFFFLILFILPMFKLLFRVTKSCKVFSNCLSASNSTVAAGNVVSV